ncbi:hypothetical protein OQA88_602 [Cercophora sp. LCS_1]
MNDRDSEAGTLAPARPPKEFFYSERLSIITRSALGVFSTVVLAVVIYTLAKWGHETAGPAIFVLPLIACVASIVVNYTAAILSYLHKYGPGGYWMWVLFFDPLIGGLAIIGFAVELSNGGDGGMRDKGAPWMGVYNAAQYLSLLVGVFHLLANAGGFYGLYRVNLKKSAALAAENAAEGRPNYI